MYTLCPSLNALYTACGGKSLKHFVHNPKAVPANASSSGGSLFSTFTALSHKVKRNKCDQLQYKVAEVAEVAGAQTAFQVLQVQAFFSLAAACFLSQSLCACHRVWWSLAQGPRSSRLKVGSHGGQNIHGMSFLHKYVCIFRMHAHWRGFGFAAESHSNKNCSNRKFPCRQVYNFLLVSCLHFPDLTPDHTISMSFTFTISITITYHTTYETTKFNVQCNSKQSTTR